MTDRFSAEVLWDFLELLATDHLAAVVPYTDGDTKRSGVSTEGIRMTPDGPITEFALSSVRRDRAAAAIMACTNVARSIERKHPTRKCVGLSTIVRRPPPRPPMRMFISQSKQLALEVDDGVDVVFLRHSVEPNTP